MTPLPAILAIGILLALGVQQPSKAAPIGAEAAQAAGELDAQATLAGRLPPKGPSSDMTPEQRYNYQIGRLVSFARACGYYSKAQELTAYHTDAESFRLGTGSLVGADTVSGCPSVKRALDETLEILSDSQG